MQHPLHPLCSWILKGKNLWHWFELHRIDNGHAAAVTYAHEKVRIPNDHHFSDYFTARHTSHIVPKESPLQVEISTGNVILNKLPKFTWTGRDLRPVHLKQRVWPVQPMKIAGNLLRTGQDLWPVRLAGRIRPIHYPSVRYPLESLILKLWHFTLPSHNFLCQDIFHDTIMRLRAAGILTKLQYDAMNPPFAIPYPKVRVNQPLSLSQLATLFFLQAIGLTCGIVALLGELCVAKLSAKSGQDQAQGDMSRPAWP